MRSSPPGARIELDKRWLLNFSSNDYLGLANNRSVREALTGAACELGNGSGASPMMSGFTRQHAALEADVAELTNRDKALVFSNGYMANIGVLTALIGPGDTVVLDALVHASLIDAAQLTHANLRRFRHADPDALEDILRTPLRGQVFVVTDAVFSMDGDLAPLDRIAALCGQYGATLVLDDAHGFGVLGRNGMGTVEHFGLNQDHVPILIATFSKAVGTYGAFVAGPRRYVERIMQGARTYIYSTALPPALLAATRTALRVAVQDHWRRDRLRQLIDTMRDQAAVNDVPLLPSRTPIQPYLIGESGTAIRLASELQARGFHVLPMLHPTVPTGQARLRISVTANHAPADIERFIAALSAASKQSSLSG